MRRWTCAGCVGVGLGLLTAAAPPGADVPLPPSPMTDAAVRRAIADLAGTGRDRAERTLVAWGRPVRPAVVAALAIAPPQTAPLLRDVLLRTGPWAPAAAGGGGGAGNNPFAFDDTSPLTQQMLAGYADLSPDERCGRVEALAQGSAQAITVDVLRQVLTGDPSPAVRWSAGNALRLTFADPPPGSLSPNGPQLLPMNMPPLSGGWIGRGVAALVTARPRPAAWPPADANAPLLAAAAWAVRWTDPAKADRLMSAALAIETAEPSAFRGQADFAFLWASDRAAERGDYPAAADRLRQLAARSPYSVVEVPTAVGDLFALHADHGPLPGFDDDLRLYAPYLTRPELMYTLARIADRGTATSRAVAGAMRAAALAASGTSAEEHCRVAFALLRHGYDGPAAAELRACRLLLVGNDNPLTRENLDFGTAGAAADRDDDAAAGHFLELAMTLSGTEPLGRTDRYGQRTLSPASQTWAEVHWHYVRAAAEAGDGDRAVAEADQILALDAADAGVLLAAPGRAAEMVPVLAAAGRAGAADECFTVAYNQLTYESNQRPADPVPKNDLAWLCAKSGRKLDEADRMSAAAVALAPGDAACLDTRAEVLGRLGRPADAAAAERRALAIKPDDVFMNRQLARFEREAAAASKR